MQRLPHCFSRTHSGLLILSDVFGRNNDSTRWHPQVQFTHGFKQAMVVLQ